MNKPVALSLILISLTALCIVTAKPAISTSAQTIKAPAEANPVPLNETLGSWVEKTPMPTSRSSLGVVTVNGKIYAIGGQTKNGTYFHANEMYDPATDSWTTMAPMPTARSSFGITVHQNKIYCIGGLVGTNDGEIETNDQTKGQIVTAANEVYDPATDMWTTKTSMITARQGAVANLVNGKIYVASGGRATSIYYFDAKNNNEVYDPQTNSWTTAAPIPDPLAGSASCAVGDEIFVIGGAWNGPHNYNQIYNVKTDNWTFGSPIPMTDVAPTAGVITDGAGYSRIFVVGSLQDNLIPTQVYDVTTDSWSNAAQMPTPRHALGIAVVNDTMYVIGGADSFRETNINEMYTPSAYIAQSPSPSASPTQSPTSSPIPSPFTSASSVQASASPSPSGQSTASLSTNNLAIAAIIISSIAIITVVFIVVLYFRKKQRQ